MDASLRLKLTRALAISAMALMALSYGTHKMGLARELYPFFYWRLFSEPEGWNGARTYRLYVRAAHSEAWQRLHVQSTPAYPRKEYSYQLNMLAEQALDDPEGRTDARERLALFAQLTVPDAVEFRIVEETYHPLALLEDATAYDTTTALRFTR